MKVTITPADIKHGKPFRLSLCPLALAMQRLTDGRVEVRLGERRAVVGARRYYLPTDAVAWGNRFDAGKKVAPITFVLRALPRGARSAEELQ